ncbi:hypothetical protein CD33_18510 [Ureibacillus sinduriensis BLB-1 = JCM 15800]|uniref:Glycosyltransferase 2-like domain-containing protein n=2 Tax=Ureibacillus sinduriensis TaxID=561440 RepID=A0A0A3IGN5_9BACL|nr:hypothetical protein CD33_18510 [Ureibacillus sinduriensis BLB-1 = JCM 15800]
MYNIEEYVEECIESLVSQTFKDLEIILVDDGSNDGTYVIAEKFARSYSHVKVLTKPNGGLSSARNFGLSYAKGEYVAFIDGDDYVLPNMFELMYQSACENGSDMVMSSFMRLVEDGTLSIDLETTQQNLFSENRCIHGKEEILQKILTTMLGVLPEADIDVALNSCVWRNLYRKKILDDLSIVFKSEREYISEDIIFHLDLLPHLQIISTVCQPLYIYRFNRNSLTKKYRPDRFLKECHLYEFLMDKVSGNNLLSDIDLRLKRSFIGRVRNCILSEIYGNEVENFWRKNKNIQEIIKNEIVVEVLQDFPIHRLNLKLRVFTNMMKYNQSIGLFILGLLYKKRYLKK